MMVLLPVVHVVIVRWCDLVLDNVRSGVGDGDNQV